jgi:hypothetical protein
MVMRRIFVQETEKLTGGSIKAQNEKLRNLWSSLNIISAIKSRSIRLAEHVACMGVREMHKSFYSEKLKGGNNLEDKGVYGRIILKCIFKE